MYYAQDYSVKSNVVKVWNAINDGISISLKALF